MNLVTSYGTMDSRVRSFIIHDGTNSHYATSITAIFLSIIKHSAMKNGELGNNILNQFLSVQVPREWSLGTRLATIATVHIYRCVFMYF